MVSSPLYVYEGMERRKYMRIYVPVDDVSSLYEEVGPSRPVPVLVHDARHLQNLLRVGQVAMEVSDGDYSSCELPSNMRLSGVR